MKCMLVFSVGSASVRVFVRLLFASHFKVSCFLLAVSAFFSVTQVLGASLIDGLPQQLEQHFGSPSAAVQNILQESLEKAFAAEGLSSEEVSCDRDYSTLCPAGPSVCLSHLLCMEFPFFARAISSLHVVSYCHVMRFLMTGWAEIGDGVTCAAPLDYSGLQCCLRWVCFSCWCSCSCAMMSARSSGSCSNAVNFGVHSRFFLSLCFCVCLLDDACAYSHGLLHFFHIRMRFSLFRRALPASFEVRCLSFAFWCMQGVVSLIIAGCF